MKHVQHERKIEADGEKKDRKRNMHSAHTHTFIAIFMQYIASDEPNVNRNQSRKMNVTNGHEEKGTKST